MRLVLDLQACQGSSMHRGIGRYSLALALAMVRNGGAHDLRIVVNSAFPDSAVALRESFAPLLAASSIHSFATPLPVAEGDPRNNWRLQAAERIREHYLASLRPDVVHVSSLFEGYGDNSVNSVLHGAGQFDTSVTLYDLIPLLRKERYLDDPNLAAWYYRKLKSLKRAELLVAISASARTEAIDTLDLAPDRVVNISSAADAIFTPRALAPEARAGVLARTGLHREFIMYTGGIDYRKNIEGLIASYAALPGEVRRQYQLAVVCSVRDPDRVRLRRLATKLRLAEDDLVLTGFVSDDDLVSLYNCTALFVFPSLHEGFGLPVLEAMACGAPVIGANASSIPEVIGRPDAMFDPTSVSAMTAAMARVLSDPAHAHSLRAHGLAQAKLFSWDASARRALAAFEETHQRRAGAGKIAIAVPAARQRLALVGATEGDAALLAELARYYDIDCIVTQPQANAAPGHATLRTVDWFEAHIDDYQRIIYQVGSAATYDLLTRYPGIALLQDFPLGDAPDRIRYDTLGYRALAGEPAPGAAYPCNQLVVERATGVIVLSPALLALALDWYGPEAVHDWRVVPAHAGAQLRDAIEACALASRGAAQQRLVDTLAAIGAGATPVDQLQVAATMAGNRLRTGSRQVLVDVTHLVQPGAADAAQRDRIRDLVLAAPKHWRIEPVRHDGTRYRYARHFTLGVLGRNDVALADAVADVGAGDVFLTLDAPTHPLSPPAWRACGVVFRQGKLDDGAMLAHQVTRH
jgi:glycosyltransferase involved in cell wall biosynthesis